MFQFRPYLKAELALLYNPHCTQDNAIKTLYRWIKDCPLLVEELKVAELSSASAFVSEAGGGSHCPAFGRAIKRPFKNASTFEVKRLGVLIKMSKRFCLGALG